MNIIQLITEEGRSIFIEVDKKEAIQVIQSLASQLESESPNKGRQEVYARYEEHSKNKGMKGEAFFTISITGR